MLRLTLTMLVLLLMKLCLVLGVSAFCVISQIYYIIKIKDTFRQIISHQATDDIEANVTRGAITLSCSFKFVYKLGKTKSCSLIRLHFSSFFPSLTDPSLIMHCQPLSVNSCCRDFIDVTLADEDDYSVLVHGLTEVMLVHTCLLRNF